MRLSSEISFCVSPSPLKKTDLQRSLSSSGHQAFARSKPVWFQISCITGISNLIMSGYVITGNFFVNGAILPITAKRTVLSESVRYENNVFSSDFTVRVMSGYDRTGNLLKRRVLGSD